MALRFGLALQELPDLQLQLGVGLLQLAHLVQVGGQTVVQVLHGHFLVVREVNGVGQVKTAAGTSTSRKPCTGRGEASGSTCAGDADPKATSASVHAGGPHAAKTVSTRKGDGASVGGHGGGVCLLWMERRE